MSVSNNVMDAACIDAISPHGGIYFTTTNVTVDDCGAWSILGNSFYERRTNAGDADRKAIYILGTLQVRPVSIVGNSNQGFNATNRTSDIHVDTISDITIVGNTCDRSASVAGTIRIAVYSCQSANVTANWLKNSPSNGQVIHFQGGVAGLFNSNLSVGSAGVLINGGAANFISGGSNHFTPGVLT